MIGFSSTRLRRWQLLIMVSSFAVLLLLWWIREVPLGMEKPLAPLLESIELHGFLNHGNLDILGCDGARHAGKVDVQQSFSLRDNITDISQSLSDHAMVDDREFDHYNALNHEHWSQFAGSGVWLPKLQVYFVVSRVVYTKPGTSWPAISFLRGQIFDETWRHMDNYSVSWAGRRIKFPTIFQIPAIWWKGGSFFGPEDPRIVLEDVPGAEPIIVFNMILNAIGYPRAMWIYKPFSDFTTFLTIQGEQRNPTEKNWAPFFHRNSGSDSKRTPSIHLHFVYSLHPLRVLRCCIKDGKCNWVFQQQISETSAASHNDPHGEMRGGTNFVKVPISGASGLQLYAGFPRTHLDFCKTGATYRPELVVLANFGAYFHVVFASVALTFGYALLDQNEIDNPCEGGRVLIPGGVLRWDYLHEDDVMTLLFGVSDAENRVIHVHGLLEFIRHLPYFEKISHGDELTDDATQNFPWLAVGNEVLLCSVEAAANSSRIDLNQEFLH